MGRAEQAVLCYFVVVCPCALPSTITWQFALTYSVPAPTTQVGLFLADQWSGRQWLAFILETSQQNARARRDSGQSWITQVPRSPGWTAHTQTTPKACEHRFYCIRLLPWRWHTRTSQHILRCHNISTASSSSLPMPFLHMNCNALHS